jgi:DnaK suppressor protein
VASKSAMTSDLVEEFRRRLQKARREILRTLATTDEELATLPAHQVGGPSEDVATEIESAVLSQLEGRHKYELDAIDAARARLVAGTYGVCEGCRRAIPLRRLRAIPDTPYCVACQHREER